MLKLIILIFFANQVFGQEAEGNGNEQEAENEDEQEEPQPPQEDEENPQEEEEQEAQEEETTEAPTTTEPTTDNPLTALFKAKMNFLKSLFETGLQAKRKIFDAINEIIQAKLNTTEQIANSLSRRT
ncbi:hypothetical protein Phum_PHUM357970 [Pediculus humanus corporis]|uniref:Uncharacterized protein n=1 Tax=Pediculus humanus subsp. corporis TaxID=121224 RepID=E0VPE9_PEDHC|nr:uncharacterized protein Phum_PHUM357970 [Pediculus humanus corporis]EEB15255.1 hypothetical protein Phum_PHUM357970 [Pediculus humanus corporis]